MMPESLVRLIQIYFNKICQQVFTKRTSGEVARADAADLHAHNRPFLTRGCLHAREPQGSGASSILTEKSRGTTNEGNRRNNKTTHFDKARTRGGSKPGAHTATTSGTIVQSMPIYGHGGLYDGGGRATHILQPPIVHNLLPERCV